MDQAMRSQPEIKKESEKKEKPKEKEKKQFKFDSFPLHTQCDQDGKYYFS